MNVNALIEQLSAFGLRTIRQAEIPTDIQTHKILRPGQTDFFSACLYVGHVSELPGHVSQSSGQASIICVEDAPLPAGFADECEINLYLAPSSVSQLDVLNKIADILIDEAWITSSMRQLLDVLYAGNGIQALVNIASRIFGNPVFVNDMAFRIVAMQHDATFHDKSLEEEKVLGYVTVENVAAMRRDKVFEAMPASNGVLLSRRAETGEKWAFAEVRIHDVLVGNVALVGNDQDIEARHVELLSRFAKLVAVEMEKDEFYRESRGIMYSYLLNDLLTGKIQSSSTVSQRLNIVGWSIGSWNRVIVIMDPGGLVPANRMQLSADRVQQIIHGSRWTTFRQSLVVFVSRNERDVLTAWERAELERFLRGDRLIAGISMCFSSLLDARIHYRQALRAIDSGVLTLRDEVLFEYGRLIPQYAVRVLLTKHDAQEFRPEQIKVVEDYDARHRTELLQTLDAYLTFVDNPVAAAQSMHIHRNTLLYRINKIREMTGLDLSDGEMRLAIQLYLRLAELQRRMLVLPS